MTCYTLAVIKTFGDKHTKELYETGRSRRVPAEILRRAVRKLEYIDLATTIRDLRVPNSNRLHELGGSRKGQFAIAVDSQWRICFRFVNGDAYDVELVDYH